MNIEKVQGSNPVAYFLDVRVKHAGKEKRKRETFVGSLREAEDRYIQIRKSLKISSGNQPLVLETFAQVLDRYFEWKQGLHRNDESRFIQLRIDLGPVRLEDLPQRLDQYFRLLRSTPTRKTGKPLGNGSINKLMMWTKAALNLATRQGLLPRNPISSYNFPRLKEVPRDVTFTQEQLETLFDTINRHAPHIRAIVQFSMEVPCRKSELINMRKRDLHLDAQHPYIRVGNTKNGKPCNKLIPTYMLPYFRNLPDETEYLFYRFDIKKGYLPLGDFKKAWKNCLIKAGITGTTFHDTRHFSISRLVDAGVPERVIMELAGWSTNMTETYYIKRGSKTLSLAHIDPISPDLDSPSHLSSQAKVDGQVDALK